jgi:hypothetical protein
MFVTNDGARIIVKRYLFDAENIDAYLLQYPQEIYAITPDGSIAASGTTLYSAMGTDILMSLPTWSPVQAFTPDFAWHVSYSANPGELRWIDLGEELGEEMPLPKVAPPDGQTVPQPEFLRWTPVKDVRNYHVYLGENRENVENAGPDSPEYLGKEAVPA